MKQYLLIAAALLSVMTSCRKSGNNSNTTPMVGYQLKIANATYSTARTTAGAGSVSWVSGFAYPDVIKLEARQGTLDVSYTSTNKDQVNLMASLATTFGNFTLPPGTYDEIKLKLDLDRNGTTPVLQLNGAFTSGLISLPVELVITKSIELQSEVNNVLIVNDSAYIAVTTIDMATVTAGITTDMLLNAQLSGGTIVISADSNRDIYDVVVDNLEHEHHHCKFDHDHDRH